MLLAWKRSKFLKPVRRLAPKYTHLVASLCSVTKCDLVCLTGSVLQVLKALQGLVLFVMFSYHTPDGKNPLWGFVGYPGEGKLASLPLADDWSGSV
jgi:hypothetical protein